MVKHWFRNTLFKERQRNKDSPYNFNNPPSTTLNLEEYERTGQAKVTSLSSDNGGNNGSGSSGNGQTFQSHNSNSNSLGQNDSRPQSHPSSVASNDRSDFLQTIKSEPMDESGNGSGNVSLIDEQAFHHHSLALAAAAAVAAQQRAAVLQQQQQQASQQNQLNKKNSIDHHHQSMTIDNDVNSNLHGSGNSGAGTNSGLNTSHSSSMYFNNFETKSESGSSEILSRPPTPNSTSFANISDVINQQIESIPINNITNVGNQIAGTNIGGGGLQNDGQNSSTSTMGPPKKFQLNKMFEKNFDANSNSSSSSTSSGKRANRTRFTDYQIKVLQEFFENNSYPKDSDLEYLSKLLLLSPRVIVVWFQVSVHLNISLLSFSSFLWAINIC